MAVRQHDKVTHLTGAAAQNRREQHDSDPRDSVRPSMTGHWDCCHCGRHNNPQYNRVKCDCGHEHCPYCTYYWFSYHQNLGDDRGQWRRATRNSTTDSNLSKGRIQAYSTPYERLLLLFLRLLTPPLFFPVTPLACFSYHPIFLPILYNPHVGRALVLHSPILFCYFYTLLILRSPLVSITISPLPNSSL